MIRTGYIKDTEKTAGDIYQFMNDKLTLADVVIVFCSERMIKSKPVELEWQSALKANKPIIPVFTDLKHVPILLKTKVGVEFKVKNQKESQNLLVKEILRRIEKWDVKSQANAKAH